jgi:Flp pilus assembly protein TadG
MLHPTIQPDRSFRRRGAMFAYLVVALIALVGVTSLAVDVTRVRLAKSELQAAADALARYTAGGLSQGVTAAQNRFTSAAAEQIVDGSALTVNASTDLEFGIWDPSTRTFPPLSGNARAGATAVRVTLNRTTARGNPVSLTFARAIGRSTADVKATAIATRGNVYAPEVEADSSPWLAGMPSGSIVPKSDGNPTDAKAPAQSPYQVTEIPIVPGQKISFRDINGMTAYEDSDWYGPDGQTDWIVRQAPVNGINATRAPLNSLVGIFLDDRAPNTWSQQPELDFSTASSRNFTTLSPKLKQVFFIGDGVNDSGQLQEFVVPTGATRFYLGIMDEKGWWWDNVGTIKTTILDNKVQLVK